MTDYIKKKDALLRAIDDVNSYFLIQMLPAEDVAPVVRCKDCKHYEYSGRLERLVCGYHRGWWVGMNENDYCSYGERRDDETD